MELVHLTQKPRIVGVDRRFPRFQCRFASRIQTLARKPTDLARVDHAAALHIWH